MSGSGLGRICSWPLIGIVHAYRIVVSPLIGVNCRFEPSCSEYALSALRQYGAVRGTVLACRRIGRCHPWGGSGYDPLPPAVGKTHKGVSMKSEALDAGTIKKREHALNHAYALISRGNRRGGFAHLDSYAATEPERVAAELWFFNAMLRWDLGDAPLFYAQELLGDLLDAHEDTAAMKVCLRCLQENPAFRPKLDDVPRLRAAALKLGNLEVANALPP